MATRHSASGRTAVISGAAGGLGLALARRYAAEGACVALLDRDAAALDRAVTGLQAAGHDARGWICDVADAGDCSRTIDAVRQAFGRIDVLVANAGISHRSAFEHTDAAVIRRVMAVNFFGAVQLTQAALPELLARRGQVVVISSVAGFAPLVARTGYAASKHALQGFFDSLRAELAPQGLGVLLVCPAFIATGIEIHALGGDGLPVRHAQAVVGRRSDADEVAARIVRAAAQRRSLLLPDAVSRAAWWLSRLAPGLYTRLMVRRVWAEMQRG